MSLLAPAVDYDAIRHSLIRSMMAATGLDENHVITMEPETPNSPRPDLPYMAYKLTSSAIKRGDDGIRVIATGSDGSQLRQYSGSRRMMASFHAFGQSHEQAYGMMATWQAQLQTDVIQEVLRTATISLWQVGDVRDLSALLGTAYEGRAQMDCTFGVLSTLNVWVPSILVASAQGILASDSTADTALAVTVETGE